MKTKQILEVEDKLIKALADVNPNEESFSECMDFINVVDNGLGKEISKKTKSIIKFLDGLLIKDGLSEEDRKKFTEIKNETGDLQRALLYYREILETTRRITKESKQPIYEKHKVVNSTRELLKQIEKSPKKNVAKISRDIIGMSIKGGEDLFFSPGISEDRRKKIKKLQEDGKLLNSSLSGLPGGGARFIKLMIALANILSEQSTFYKTDKKLIGIPDEVLSNLQLGIRRINKEIDLKEIDKNGKKIPYEFPVIIFSYEGLTRALLGKGKGEKIGGKDIKETKDYLNEVSGKEYLFAIPGGYAGLKFMEKTSLYTQDGNDWGAVSKLTPHFCNALNSYAKFRPDTLEKLSGKQTLMTMKLLEILIFNKGRKDKDGNLAPFRKNKKELIINIIGETRYKKNPKEVEKEFQDSINIMRYTLGLLSNYEESKKKEVISIFNYNPEYL